MAGIILLLPYVIQWHFDTNILNKFEIVRAGWVREGSLCNKIQVEQV